MKFLIFLYVYNLAYPAVVKSDDFRIQVMVYRPQQSDHKLIIEYKNKKCSGSQQQKSLRLSSDLCRKIQAQAATIQAAKYFSIPATEHRAFYEVRYTSSSLSWSKRISEVDPSSSPNQAIHELVSTILKGIPVSF